MKTHALLTIVAAISLAGCNPSKAAPDQPKAAQAAAPGFDKSPAKQAERLSIITDLQKTGVLGTIDYGPAYGARVNVRQAFMDIDMADKRNVASLLFAYYFPDNGKDHIVLFLDSRSGKTIGNFTASYGLQLEY